ncbi:MAG: hypothetical protein J7647_32240 [Cyanobacteria bacterium SBLK]|nr:hypothetical protein [Cyanobacteria bacterium SBLK]
MKRTYLPPTRSGHYWFRGTGRNVNIKNWKVVWIEIRESSKSAFLCGVEHGFNLDDFQGEWCRVPCPRR